VPAVNMNYPADPTAERIPFHVDGMPSVDNGRMNISINWASANDDWDLYVVDSTGKQVASSASGGTTGERAVLFDPPAGDYTVFVHAAAGGNGSASTGELSTWVLGRPQSTGRDLTVATEQAARRPGAPFRSTVSWAGLDPTQRWFGIVRYAGSDRRTLLRIG
jgi:hypothetical protein